MKVFLATILSLVLGIVPHNLALASLENENPGCCGCQCGMQPTPRPAAQQSVPVASIETRDENSDLRSTEAVAVVQSILPVRRVEVCVAPVLLSDVPLFQRHCALLI